MLGRRLLVLAVVLAGLAVLAASVAPREAADPVTRSPVVSAPPAAPPAAPSPESAERGTRPAASARDVPGEPPLRTIAAGEPFAPIAVPVGQRIRLAVTGERVGSVQVGRDGPIQSIDPVSPARFDLLYSTPGRQEVRVFGPGLSKPRVIGALEVRPRA